MFILATPAPYGRIAGCAVHSAATLRARSSPIDVRLIHPYQALTNRTN